MEEPTKNLPSKSSYMYAARPKRDSPMMLGQKRKMFSFTGASSSELAVGPFMATSVASATTFCGSSTSRAALLRAFDGVVGCSSGTGVAMVACRRVRAPDIGKNLRCRRRRQSKRAQGPYQHRMLSTTVKDRFLSTVLSLGCKSYDRARVVGSSNPSYAVGRAAGQGVR